MFLKQRHQISVYRSKKNIM